MAFDGASPEDKTKLNQAARPNAQDGVCQRWLQHDLETMKVTKGLIQIKGKYAFATELTLLSLKASKISTMSAAMPM